MSDKLLDLRKCSFKGANLSGKVLSGALMSDADMSDSNMQEAVLTKVCCWVVCGGVVCVCVGARCARAVCALPSACRVLLWMRVFFNLWEEEGGGGGCHVLWCATQHDPTPARLDPTTHTRTQKKQTNRRTPSAPTCRAPT